MNKLKSGEVYTAVRQKSGTTRVGNWELLVTRDANGKNEIAVFVRNVPSTVREGDSFRIDRIHSVSSGFRKDTEDRWYPAIAVDADVSVVEHSPVTPPDEPAA